ncbi:hypothetical protein [Actinoplanes sp. NPDC020271]|uniref:hypothetical protein n=1 Tax=Actinoplanes sp. NPDC020271 TaxID=3363896 RepID=UPI0037A1DD63
MRSLGTRRAALVAGVATVGVIALAGCSAGQVAETAMLDTPIAGINANSADGSVAVRDAQVEYNGVEGYEKGENAPLQLSLFNQSPKDVTISIASTPLEQPQVVSATQVGFVSTAAGASASAPAAAASSAPAAAPSVTPSGALPGASGAPSSASSAPAAPTVAPAQITIKALGSAVFKPSDVKKLQAVGLSDDLKPGQSVNLVFHFSNGSPDLVIQAPVAVPLSPASRAPGLSGDHTEE